MHSDSAKRGLGHRSMIIAARVLLAAGLATAAAGQETITLRSGADLNPCVTDPSITFIRNSQSRQPLRTSAFTVQDFANARGGGSAWAVNPFAGWLDPAAFSYAGAQWIAVDCNRTPRSALYAIEFQVATECIGSATLDFCFTVDDWLGDGKGGPNLEGLYLNESPIPNTSGAGHSRETCWAGIDVTALLQPGPNTLYVYKRDVAASASGVIFGATFHVQPAAPILLGNALTSNRFNAMPDDTFQVVVDYDGHAAAFPTLDIQFRHVATDVRSWVTLDIVPGTINTFEFDLCGNEPTCRVDVAGVVPNGVIDGLAFGFYWKDAQGNYHMLKSSGGPNAAQSNFIGAWPRSYSDSSWESATPQLGTCGICRHQARMTLYGAQLLLDGSYNLCCPVFPRFREYRP